MIEELPIRLAHRAKELDELPHNLSDMPSIKKVKNWYCQSFSVRSPLVQCFTNVLHYFVLQELIGFPKFQISPSLKRCLYASANGRHLPESIPNPSLYNITSTVEFDSPSVDKSKLRVPIEKRCVSMFLRWQSSYSTGRNCGSCDMHILTRKADIMPKLQTSSFRPNYMSTMLVSRKHWKPLSGDMTQRSLPLPRACSNGRRAITRSI